MAVRRFLLPDLGEGLEDAEVVTWRVAEGDSIDLNQTLVDVNTAKALVEIPSPWDGIVEALHAGEGDVVKVGEPLVSIRVAEEAESPGAGEAIAGAESAAGENSGAESAAAERAAQAAMETGREAADDARPKRRAVLVGYGVAEDDVAPRRSSPERDRSMERTGPVPASPPVRRLAKELGVDLSAVDGSGPGGRVTREDVLKAADGGSAAGREAAPAEPIAAEAEPETGDQRIPVRGTRRLIAEKMSRSAREIPHVTTFLTVDASWLQALREQIEGETGQRISPLPIVVLSLAQTIRDHPKLNASFDAERSEIVLRGRIHVGIATDTEQGLLAPVVRDAGSLGLLGLAAEIARLTEAARAGTAQPQELVGSTITVTNVGTFGAEFGTPIINHPEAAILALGVVERRPLVADDRIEARPAVTLSLSFDHRVLDGAEAGRALKALADLLENPLRLGALPR